MFQPTTQGLEIHTTISIPIEPVNKIPRTLSPFELDYLANGDCVCWELIGSLASLGEYDSIVERICGYHKQYLSNRAASSNVPCACQQYPKDHYCTDCGRCHKCHRDLCTTSTVNFHRCACPLCLHRCCGLLGISTDHLDQTRRRHQILRTRQSVKLCPLDSAPSTTGYPKYHVPRTLTHLRTTSARQELLGTYPPPSNGAHKSTKNTDSAQDFWVKTPNDCRRDSWGIEGIDVPQV